MDKKTLKIGVGSNFKVDFGRGNLNNHTAEIRAIIDEDYVVYKTGKGKYHIDLIYLFELYHHEGHLKPITKNEKRSKS